MDWDDYRGRLLHAAKLHYGHLDGHHRNEDADAFPRMRLAYPRLNKGFELLENDHHHIEHQLHLIQTLLLQLRQSEGTPKPELAEKLAESIEHGGEWLYRHLADEEDLVIPILALEEQR